MKHFTTATPSSQLGVVQANEIKHNHWLVVNVVIKSRNDLSYKAYAYLSPQYSYNRLCLSNDLEGPQIALERWT